MKIQEFDHRDKIRSVTEARNTFGNVYADSVFLRLNRLLEDGKITMRQIRETSLLDILAWED